MKLQNSLYLFIFVLVVLISFYFKQRSKSGPAKKEPVVATQEVTDIFIPRGSVLVPVDLTNAEAIGHLLGGFGYVDLFTSDHNTQLVLSKTKLLQAPLNPAVYAVLIKDAEARILMSYSGPYKAVLYGKSNWPQKKSKTAHSATKDSRSQTAIRTSIKNKTPAFIEVEYQESL